MSRIATTVATVPRTMRAVRRGRRRSNESIGENGPISVADESSSAVDGRPREALQGPRDGPDSPAPFGLARSVSAAQLFAPAFIESDLECPGAVQCRSMVTLTSNNAPGLVHTSRDFAVPSIVRHDQRRDLCRVLEVCLDGSAASTDPDSNPVPDTGHERSRTCTRAPSRWFHSTILMLAGQNSWRSSPRRDEGISTDQGERS